jgi:hypothetical protein
MSRRVNIEKTILFKFFGISIVFLFTCFSSVYAQTSSLSGEVSFVTSQNIYLRFESTEKMMKGDTLFILDEDIEIPCLRLLEKSSISCVAVRLGACDPEKGDAVIHRYTESVIIENGDENEDLDEDSEDENPELLMDSGNNITQEIDGRISIANYTTSGYGDSKNTNVARLALDIENVAGSKLSFESYSNFRYDVTGDLSVHEAVLSYDYDSSMTISLGRQINRRMYSLGATDGLHIEKRFRKYFVGIVAGSNPDPYSYSVNTDILQYGVSFGVFHNSLQSSSTSFGFVDRSFMGSTDRRYAFLQHNSRIGNNLSVYSSAELDLYDGARLRMLYMSANYRASSKLRFSASINLRKNLILYESFINDLDLDSLIANDPLKSSFRFSLSYKISNRLYCGARYSMRHQSDGNNSFSNFSGYLNISDFLGGRLSNSFSANRNEYFQYYSVSTRFSRRFFNSKLTVSPNARALIYSYFNFDVDPINHLYFGVDSDYYVKDGLTLSAFYDFSSRSGVLFHRFTVKIIQRF